MVVISNENKGDSVYDLQGATRADGTITINLPPEYSGDEVHAYLGFISEDGASIAESVYVGTVTIT